jgi:hypothetical protein
MLAQIQQNAPAAPVASRPGLGDSIMKAISAYAAPTTGGIDVPIKAGMTPDQVTAVNQQLLGEQELAARTAQAEKESARQDQTAAMQMQEMEMSRQMQQVKLAEMMMPKRNVQIAPDGTVIDLESIGIGTQLGQAPLTADQVADNAARDKAFGLDEKQLAAQIDYQNRSLAQDDAQHAASLAASRASAGAGTKDWNFSEKYGVFVNERTGEWKEAPGLPGAGEEPLDPNALMAGIRLARPDIDTLMETMIPPEEMVKINGALGDLQGEDRSQKRSGDIRAYLKRSDPDAYYSAMDEEQVRGESYARAERQNWKQRPGAAAPGGPQVDPTSGHPVDDADLDESAPPPTVLQTLADKLGISPAVSDEVKKYLIQAQLGQQEKMRKLQAGMPITPSGAQLATPPEKDIAKLSPTEMLMFGIK